MEDDLDFTRARLCAVEERLDEKCAAADELDALNKRLRERLELFQRQNDENCRAAEAELARLARELDRSEDVAQFHRSEASSVSERFSRASEQLMADFKDRDEAVAALTERTEELAQFERALHASPGAAVLEKVRTFVRLDHLEGTAAHFREHQLQWRVWQMYMESVALCQLERKAAAFLCKRAETSHFKAWKRLSKAVSRRITSKSENASLHALLEAWLNKTTRSSIAYKQKVNVFRSRPVFSIWRAWLRISKTSQAKTLTICSAEHRLRRYFGNWSTVFQKVESYRQRVQRWKGFAQRVTLAHVLRTAVLERARQELITVKQRRILIIWSSTADHHRIRRIGLQTALQAAIYFRTRKEFDAWFNVTRKRNATRILEGSIERIFRHHAKKRLHSTLAIWSDSTRETRAADLRKAVRSLECAVKEGKVAKRLEATGALRFGHRAAVNALQALKSAVDSRKALGILSARVGDRRRRAALRDWTLAYWRRAAGGAPVLKRELTALNARIEAAEQTLEVRLQRALQAEAAKEQAELALQTAAEEVASSKREVTIAEENLSAIQMKAAQAEKLIETLRDQAGALEAASRAALAEGAASREAAASAEAAARVQAERHRHMVERLQAELEDKLKAVDAARDRAIVAEEELSRQGGLWRAELEGLLRERGALESQVAGLRMRLQSAEEKAHGLIDARAESEAQHREDMKLVHQELAEAMRIAREAELRLGQAQDVHKEQALTVRSLQLELDGVHRDRDEHETRFTGKLLGKSDWLRTHSPIARVISNSPRHPELRPTPIAKLRTPTSSASRADVDMSESFPVRSGRFDVSRKFEELERRLSRQLGRN